uniref:F-box domain-containing protein n=1 Tax=Hanusia phi TaxID=3032 RepID=A0A7S0HAH7_9CRYP
MQNPECLWGFCKSQSFETKNTFDDNMILNLSDILHEILIYLPSEEIGKVMSTCRMIYKISNSEHLWRRLAFRDFPPHLSVWDVSTKGPSFTWKCLYKKAHTDYINLRGIYAIGGCCKRLQALCTVYRFEVDQRIWREVPELQHPRFFAVAAELQSKLYIMGGMQGAFERLKSVECYDGHSGWKSAPEMTSPRSSHCAAVLHSKIYAIGGDNLRGALSSVERLNTALGKWERVADLNHARSFAAAAVLDGCIYVAGGLDNNKNVLDSVERYDESVDKWTIVTLMSSPRVCMQLVSVSGKLYFAGGFDEMLQRTGAVESYDPVTGTWKKMASLNRDRGSFALVALGGVLHVIGSKPDQSGSRCSMEKYNYELDRWDDIARQSIEGGAAEGKWIPGSDYFHSCRAFHSFML